MNVLATLLSLGLEAFMNQTPYSLLFFSTLIIPTAVKAQTGAKLIYLDEYQQNVSLGGWNLRWFISVFLWTSNRKIHQVPPFPPT